MHAINKAILQIIVQIKINKYKKVTINKAILQIIVQIKINNSKKDKNEWNLNKKKSKKLVNNVE